MVSIAKSLYLEKKKVGSKFGINEQTKILSDEITYVNYLAGNEKTYVRIYDKSTRMRSCWEMTNAEFKKFDSRLDKPSETAAPEDLAVHIANYHLTKKKPTNAGF